MGMGWKERKVKRKSGKTKSGPRKGIGKRMEKIVGREIG